MRCRLLRQGEEGLSISVDVEKCVGAHQRLAEGGEGAIGWIFWDEDGTDCCGHFWGVRGGFRERLGLTGEEVDRALEFLGGRVFVEDDFPCVPHACCGIGTGFTGDAFCEDGGLVEHEIVVHQGQ